MNQESLCRAFCGQLRVREVPKGYAISTPLESFPGEDLAFYAIKSGDDGGYRIFEDGTLVPHLEAAGATLDNDTRHDALTKILQDHHSCLDEYRGELFRTVRSGETLEEACLDFMSLLVRTKDLLLMVQEKAESTFREDVRALIISALADKAEIKEQEPVSVELAEISPDMVLRAKGRDPVALFIATTAPKLHEAIELQFMATYEQRIPLKVIAMIKSNSSISGRVRVRADNRLDAVPQFRSEEAIAVERVAKEVLGWQALVGSRVH